MEGGMSVNYCRNGINLLDYNVYYQVRYYYSKTCWKNWILQSSIWTADLTVWRTYTSIFRFYFAQ